RRLACRHQPALVRHAVRARLARNTKLGQDPARTAPASGRAAENRRQVPRSPGPPDRLNPPARPRVPGPRAETAGIRRPYYPASATQYFVSERSTSGDRRMIMILPFLTCALAVWYGMLGKRRPCFTLWLATLLIFVAGAGPHLARPFVLAL